MLGHKIEQLTIFQPQIRDVRVNILANTAIIFMIRKAISCGLVFMLVISCTNAKDEEGKSISNVQPPITEEKTDSTIRTQEVNIFVDSERVSLMAAYYSISSDTLEFILRDYLSKTNYSILQHQVNYDTLLTNISTKYHISKRTVSKLIFGYKYTFLSESDIRDEMRQEILEEEYESSEYDAEPGEEYNPYP